MNYVSPTMPMCVQPLSAEILWGTVRPMVEAAYAEVDEVMPADTLAGLIAGKLLLWVSFHHGDVGAILITALLPRPSGLSCKLVVAAGIGERNWAAWHARIESYARAEGCVKLCVEGRPGWARVLPGYETKRVVLEKRL